MSSRTIKPPDNCPEELGALWGRALNHGPLETEDAIAIVAALLVVAGELHELRLRLDSRLAGVVGIK